MSGINYENKPFEKLCVEILHERETPKDIVKHELLKQLANNLTEYVRFNTAQQPFFENPYRAKFVSRALLHVAKPEITNALVKEEGYFVDGTKFSESDIQQAIKETFPERLI